MKTFIADFDDDYLVRNVTHSNGSSYLFNETYGYEKMYQINTITDNVNSTNLNKRTAKNVNMDLTNNKGNKGGFSSMSFKSKKGFFIYKYSLKIIK